MNWLLPIVMGTTAFMYVTIFNHTMKIYGDSGYTMTWQEFVDKKIEVASNPFQTNDTLQE
jgi:hypothetical protein